MLEPKQKPLIVENLEAVLHAVGAATGGIKALACAICPEFSYDPDEALKKLSRKLNSKAKEVFSDEDMDRAIEYGRQHECHLLKWWKDENQGYKRAEPQNRPSELLLIRAELKQIAERQYQLQRRADTIVANRDGEDAS